MLSSFSGTFQFGRRKIISLLSGFSYSNFSSTTDLTLVSCSVTNNNIYLTTAVAGDVGNVYRTISKYNSDFSMTWNMDISGGTGADGFCLQWTKTNNTNGSSGGGCGIISSTDTIHALQFQTWSNTAFRWYKNNVSQSSQTINIRGDYYYWADYVHSSQTMNIYWSTTNSKPGSADVSLTNFQFDSNQYYIGFGAATGGSTDNHILKSWTLTFN